MRRSTRLSKLSSGIDNPPSKTLSATPTTSKTPTLMKKTSIAAKEKVPSKRKSTSRTPKETAHDTTFELALSELDKAFERRQQCLQDKEKLNLKDIQDLQKKFKQTCDKTKRETQILDQNQALRKTAGTTRSGTKRGVVKQAFYSNGKWIDKGITDSKENFDAEEKEYLKETINKIKEVKDLKFEHLKYLILDIYFGELESIKAGKTDSEFHKRYFELKGKGKGDLLAEIRLSLFTNEQRDYINGLLQGAFDTDSKDAEGQIKHLDIDYVSIVMLAEATIRVVRYVHKFESNEEAFSFTIKRSREALGL